MYPATLFRWLTDAGEIEYPFWSRCHLLNILQNYLDGLSGYRAFSAFPHILSTLYASSHDCSTLTAHCCRATANAAIILAWRMCIGS